MCELDILHDSLYQFCPELHLKRLNSLTLACHALLDCKTLTLTELGRNLPTKARTKHNIKRIDRLWICPYISRHLLSLNPLLACCRRYSRGER
ncbi:hypothetical protein IFX65_004186 [Escherichia coli]|nr:hypothetical protein [Escherichia coli]EHI1009014.1 hypothetical protein [Escherichia coli]